MGFLAQSFREQVKKTKDIAQASEMTYTVSYPTGFLPLDFANGYCMETSGQPGKVIYQLGISDGSINMIIADSGVGKTTFACQAACNIIRPFKTSTIFFEEAEVGANIPRIKALSGFTNEEFKERFIIRDSGITTESVFRRVKTVYDIKMENYDEYSYDTGLVDDDGKPVIKLEPTVFVIDSIKMIMPEKLAEDQATNMSGAQTAKGNSDAYTRMVPMCRMANIILITINHITVDVNTGITPKKADLAFLKQGEKISGGRSLSYIQNNIFRFDIVTKLKKEETFGINGSIVAIDIVKSRNNESGRKLCKLIFNQSTGYDPDLSLFIYLKDNNLLEGSGAYLKLPGCETKFSMKKFKDLLYSDEQFYAAFVNVCIENLKASLLDSYLRNKEISKEQANRLSPYQSILSGLYS
jgi:RecA/RadA recombinase